MIKKGQRTRKDPKKQTIKFIFYHEQVLKRAVREAREESLSTAGHMGSSGGHTAVQGINLADYVPWWIAEYGVSQCDFPSQYPNKHMAAWQDSESGNIDGTNVDTDQWNDNPS